MKRFGKGHDRFNRFRPREKRLSEFTDDEIKREMARLNVEFDRLAAQTRQIKEKIATMQSYELAKAQFTLNDLNNQMCPLVYRRGELIGEIHRRQSLSEFKWEAAGR